jgi:hypothetical protein
MDQMNKDGRLHLTVSEPNAKCCESLLDDLEMMLAKQIDLASDGSIAALEIQSRRTDSLVERIAQGGFLDLPEFKDRRGRLQNSYNRLGLAIAARRAETAEDLSRVRKVRKTVAIYRNSI